MSKKRAPKYVLGVETSCDETSAAVLENGATILSNVIATQFDVHAEYGGVVPELASRRHIEVVSPVIDKALATAGITIDDVELIAVTTSPGLIGSLTVGLSAAKGIAYANNIPFIGVNHIEGHLNAVHLENTDIEYPYIGLVVSGGHTSLYYVKKFGDYKLLGATRDDAAGEAFDKVAKLMGIGFPGGPKLEKAAEGGNAERYKFTMPKLNTGSKFQKARYDFSFSGLKTAVLNYFRSPDFKPSDTQDLAASFQRAVSQFIVKNIERVLEDKGAKGIVVSGGVAANKKLRESIAELATHNNIKAYFPSLELCTDNAAMIAFVGARRYELGEASGWDQNADSTKGM